MGSSPANDFVLPEGIVFDLDGVLVPTHELHDAAWRIALESRGIEYPSNGINLVRGLSREASLAVLLRNRVVEPKEFEEMLAEKDSIYRSKMASLTVAFVDARVVQLLRDLKDSGIRLAIASRSRNAQLVVQRTGLAELVDALITGDDFEASNADGFQYVLAAERIGCSKEACIVVEDSVPGMVQALSRGFQVFGVGPAYCQGIPGVLHLGDATSDMFYLSS